MNHYFFAGMFPSLVPVMSLPFPEWDVHFLIPSENLLLRPGEYVQRSRTEILRILHESLRGLRPGYSVSFDYDLETWAFRSLCESI